MSINPVKILSHSSQLLQPPSTYFKRVRHKKDRMAVVKIFFEKTIAPIYGNQNGMLKKIEEGKDRKCRLLYSSDKNPIGVVVWKSKLNDVISKNSLKIKTLALIDPEKNSGKGFGSCLLKKIEKVANEKKASHITVSVSGKAPNALAFFKHKGFKIVKEEKNLYKKNVTEFFLSRKIGIKENDNQLIGEKRKSVKRRDSLDKKKREEIDLPPRKKMKKHHNNFERIQNYNEEDIDLDPSRNTNYYSPTKIHKVTLKGKYLNQILDGSKTIEGRVNSPMFQNMRTGDKINFFNSWGAVTCLITNIIKYGSFAQMIEKENHKKVLSDISSKGKAIQVYNNIPGYEKKAKRWGGVLAIHIKKL